jgi:ATP-dependent DNA ligase
LKTRPERSQLDTFVNLPDKRPSRWGDALTADKMKKCVWLRPERVAQVEFLEWTSGVSPARTVCRAQIREDKEAREVVKEHAGESASTRVE